MMSELITKDLLQTLTERLTNGATVQKVYGEPIVAGHKTIIPVARIMLGFGGGFGEGSSGRRPEAADHNKGESGGAGGGLMVQPQGVIEVTPEKTQYIPLRPIRYIAIGVAVGLVLSGMLGLRRGRH